MSGLVNKKVIYTVITNDYDDLKTPRVVSSGYDYICFTDNKELTSDFWQIRYVNKQSRHLQREIKVLCCEYLKEYYLSIYVDGSMLIKRNIADLENVAVNDIVFCKHPIRNCIYDEEEAVLRLGKDVKEVTSPQIEKYRNEGMTEQFGMYQTGVILRKHTKEVKDFCKLWWTEIEKHSHRDQLSVTYAQWKSKIQVSIITPNELNRYLKIHRHATSIIPEGLIKVFYSTPGHSDKNIGKAYNEFMSTVPNGAWVCLRDGDTIFLTPDWCKHIEDIISENGEKYDIIGCVTNRLRSEHQLVSGMFDEDSVTAHVNKAKEVRSNDVVDAKGISGLCMIFRKSLWDKVKFKENSIKFDTEFCRDVKRAKGRIGVATGLYLFHLYRWGKENPKDSIEHLL